MSFILRCVWNMARPVTVRTWPLLAFRCDVWLNFAVLCLCGWGLNIRFTFCQWHDPYYTCIIRLKTHDCISSKYTCTTSQKLFAHRWFGLIPAGLPTTKRDLIFFGSVWHQNATGISNLFSDRGPKKGLGPAISLSVLYMYNTSQNT